MINMKIVNKEKFISISMKKVKYIIGKNIQLKYFIYNELDNFFSKLKHSEYAIDSNNLTNIFINEQEVNINDVEYYLISDLYNISSELKIGSKSLFSKYIECLFDKIEYTEEFQTFSIITEELSKMINEKINELIANIQLNIDINITKKDIFKNMTLSLIKNDMEINNYDIDIKEKILIQIKMISKICKIIKKKTLILIYSNILDNKIINELTDLEPNCFVLVLTNNVNNINYEDKDVMILDNLIIDLYNDDEVYNYGIENGIMSIEESRKILIKRYSV